MVRSERPAAMVTGASSGIGAAFAERLARAGHDVVVVARRKDRLEGRAAAEPRLSVLVNNAGFAGYKPFTELPPETADDLVDVHVRAATRLTLAALPGMVERGTGAVVNVASLLAFSGSLPPQPLPHRAVYAACKAYLVAFSELLQAEVGPSGVRVQVCCPGLVETEFHDVAGVDRSRFRIRPMSPDEVARASLRGLELGETLCAPGLRDPGVIDALHESQRRMLQEGNRPELAERYA
jgi:uncharacterized protein